MTTTQPSADGAGDSKASQTTGQDRVRLGILGAGSFVSRRHLPESAGNAHVVVTALCRRDPDALATMASHFGLTPEQTYVDWKEMLERAPLDAVLIATPNSYHYEMAAACLERGLHVLLEKPMTVRSEDAHALVALAEERSLQMSVALNPPFWAHCHQIRRALKEEKMGALESAAMYWTGNVEHVFGRVPMPDSGCRRCTTYVVPRRSRTEWGRVLPGWRVAPGVADALGHRSARAPGVCRDGCHADRSARPLCCSNWKMARSPPLLVSGTANFPLRRVRNVWGAANGTITVVNPDFETSIMLHGQEHRKFKEADLLPVPGPITNFVDAIQGRGKLFATAEHGAHVVEVVEAAYQSAAAGHAITLPPCRPAFEKAVVMDAAAQTV